MRRLTKIKTGFIILGIAIAIDIYYLISLFLAIPFSNSVLLSFVLKNTLWILAMSILLNTIALIIGFVSREKNKMALILSAGYVLLFVIVCSVIFGFFAYIGYIMSKVG